MKIDKLLKRLENIEIVGNIDERRKIAEYLAQVFDFKKERDVYYYFILKDKKSIYGADIYEELVLSKKVSPTNAYVYVETPIYPKYYAGFYDVIYFYPFLHDVTFLTDAYLSKLGFYSSSFRIVPATGLKYLVSANRFSDFERVGIEVVDIGTVAINLNLPKIVYSVLEELSPKKHKQLFYNDIEKIVNRLISQRLFAGYDFDESKNIVNKYYGNNDTSLAKDIEAIRDAYNRIFQPYRVVYYLNTKRFTPT